MASARTAPTGRGIEPADPTRMGPGPGGWTWIMVTLAGVTTALTLVFLAMRSVLEVGGFCAEGGPFEIRHPCPEGVSGLMVGGIFALFIFGIAYVGLSTKHGVPSFAWLLWPGLFLSLGWNFLEFGLRPPDGRGLAWGWLSLAALFAAMGGLPLVGLASGLLRRFLARAAAPEAGWWGAVPQIGAVAAGIWGGAALFGAVTG